MKAAAHFDSECKLEKEDMGDMPRAGKPARVEADASMASRSAEARVARSQEPSAQPGWACSQALSVSFCGVKAWDLCTHMLHVEI